MTQPRDLEGGAGPDSVDDAACSGEKLPSDRPAQRDPILPPPAEDAEGSTPLSERPSEGKPAPDA